MSAIAKQQMILSLKHHKCISTQFLGLNILNQDDNWFMCDSEGGVWQYFHNLLGNTCLIY